MTHMIILSSSSPLFEAKAVNYSVEELRAEVFDETNRKGVLCKEISCFDAAFAKQLPVYLSKIHLTKYNELSRNSEQWMQLGKHLTSSLVHPTFWPPCLQDHLVIRDISIEIVAKEHVKKNLINEFTTAKDNLKLWNEGAKDTLEIDDFIPNRQRDRLVNHICFVMTEYILEIYLNSMPKKKDLARTMATSMEKRFVSKIISTLNRGDRIIHSIFIVDDQEKRGDVAKILLSNLKNPLFVEAKINVDDKMIQPTFSVYA
jgi:hypothetical protein